jgi:hypothetical protein
MTRGNTMRIAALESVLSIIAVSAVTMLGAGPAAAIVVCQISGPTSGPTSEVTFHLHSFGSNPVEFTLPTIAPVAGPAKFVDSPALKRTGTYPYPYTLIAEWDDGYIGNNSVNCVLQSLSPLEVWLGLRNSDDQGTNFDLRADVSFTSSVPNSPTIVIATTEALCITGLTRNPALANEITSTFPAPLHVAGDGEFSLTLSARIASPACGGHANATGLRVYYDSADRDSLFDALFSGGP